MTIKLREGFKLRKVLSGGQTGADKTALVCAKRLGLATGGTVPKGCRTEDGPDRSLVTEFGCVESASHVYSRRTRDNVCDSNATVWFGDPLSPGGKLTVALCDFYQKPLFLNPLSLVQIAEDFEVINGAGNRRSTNPAVVGMVELAFETLEKIIIDIPL